MFRFFFLAVSISSNWLSDISYDYSLEDATSAKISFGDKAFEEKLQQKIARTEVEIRKLKREMQLLEDLQTLSQAWRENRFFIRVEEWN